MIGADDILVHYILKSEYAQFPSSRILYLERGFITYLRWIITRNFESQDTIHREIF